MKIACFSPNDAIWLWTFSQANFLEALKNRGDRIFYIHCDRTLSSYCTVMAVHSVMPGDDMKKKERLCVNCTRQSSLVRERYGFDSIALHTLLDPDDYFYADSITEQLTVEDLIDHSINNVSVGKAAAYEAVIQAKHISKKISGLAEEIYRKLFRNSLLVAIASRRLMFKIKPELCISYHTAYAYNRTFQLVADSLKIPVYSLSTSFNMNELDSYLIAYRGDPLRNLKKMVEHWPKVIGKTCSRMEMIAASSHMLALITGRGYAFSVPVKASAGRFVIPNNKFALVVLSSYDELMAADLAGFSGWSIDNDIFQSQVDWIKWIIEFASKNPDIHFVIRVHPREFPIKGLGQRSAHINQLNEVFSKRPANVLINMPSDHVPLYDLMLKADAVLVSWSSAGMEAGMLGIPVVSYFGEALAYPSSLIYHATTREEYQDMVNQALQRGWSFEQSRMFFRWAALSLVRSRIQISSLSSHQNQVYKFFGKLIRFMRRSFTPWSGEEWQVAFRMRALPDRKKIYQLIDEELDGLYLTTDDFEEQNSFPDETKALQDALITIARTYEGLSGVRAHKLFNLINTAQVRKH